MRIHQAAIFGDGADAVGIAIGGETGVTLVGNDRFLQAAQVRQNRLGIHSRKQWVDLTVNFQMIDAKFLEYACEDAAPRAVHYIDGKLLLRAGNEIEISKGLDRGDVVGLEVRLHHAAALALDGLGIDQALRSFG